MAPRSSLHRREITDIAESGCASGADRDEALILARAARSPYSTLNPQQVPSSTTTPQEEGR